MINYGRHINRRSGVTLIEIMVSVLVLSVGLLGIIAAIPFGGFQMEKMRDKDFTAMVGRNAMAQIESNAWHLPGTWQYGLEFGWQGFDNTYRSRICGVYNYGAGNLSNYFLKNYSGGSSYGYINLFYPIVLDGIGPSMEGNIATARPSGLFCCSTNNFSDAFTVAMANSTCGFIRVCPRLNNFNRANNAGQRIQDNTDLDGYGNTRLPYFQARMDYIFRTHDDLNYGIPGKTDKTHEANDPTPRIESEGSQRAYVASSPLTYPYDRTIGDYTPVYENRDDFTGAYSWMAMLQPKTCDSDSLTPLSSADIIKIIGVDVDVVVFKNRIDSTPVFLKVQRVGYSKGGGTFRLSYRTADFTSYRSLYNNADFSSGAVTTIDITNQQSVMRSLGDSLKSTSHLLLQGNDPNSCEWVGSAPLYRKFSKWYKIANRSEVFYNQADDAYCIDVTLIGPDCPDSDGVNTAWISSARAVVFPYVTGVYSKTLTVKEN